MILINNQLIYVATPKTGTQSIKQAIVDSGVPYEEFNKTSTSHYHTTLSEMYNKWGLRESFCIERDWFQRWISGLTFLIHGYIVSDNLKLKFKLSDINNEFIFKYFDKTFVGLIYSPLSSDFKKAQERFVYNTEDIQNPSTVKVLCPSSFWKSGKKCTYEFELNSIHLFKDFFEEKFNRSLVIPHNNKSQGSFSLPNLVLNDELRNFVYENFESDTVNRLI